MNEPAGQAELDQAAAHMGELMSGYAEMLRQVRADVAAAKMPKKLPPASAPLTAVALNHIMQATPADVRAQPATDYKILKTPVVRKIRYGFMDAVYWGFSHLRECGRQVLVGLRRV